MQGASRRAGNDGDKGALSEEKRGDMRACEGTLPSVGSGGRLAGVTETERCPQVVQGGQRDAGAALISVCCTEPSPSCQAVPAHACGSGTMQSPGPLAQAVGVVSGCFSFSFQPSEHFASMNIHF